MKLGLFSSETGRKIAKEILYLSRILLYYRKHCSIRRKGHRIVVEVQSHDCHLYLDPLDNGVAKPLYSGSGYEKAETRLLNELLKPGYTFVDVGANIGYFATLASKRVGSDGAVLAIEPDPGNFQLLEMNVLQNRLENVRLFNLAAGASMGEGLLFKSHWNLGDHRLYASSDDSRHSVRVPIRTVDEIVADAGFEEVDIIKVDVQGYESFVQKGMTRTLAQSKALSVITEYWPYGMKEAGGSPEEYIQTFMDMGYAAYIVTNDTLVGPFTTVESIDANVPPINMEYPDASYLNLLMRKV
jgi:FkbM family methyltransferase